MEINDDSLHSSERIKMNKYENIFNHYFICKDTKIIKTLYTKTSDRNVWSHPLILNYDHCLFCMEYSKSPYLLSCLHNSHIQVHNLYKFFASKGINFKYQESKPMTRRIRRLIRSNESKQIIKDRKIRSNYYRSSSDTDIYFDKEVNRIDKEKKIKERANSASSNKLKQRKNKKKNEIDYSLIEKKIEMKTDNANMKMYKRKKTPKDSDIQIMKYLNNNCNSDNESLSLTEYNDNITLVINNPLFQTLHIKNILNRDDNNNSSNNKTKQDTCEICFQEPEDKIVISCGEFYCRDCLKIYIMNCINNISQFNKLYCPKEICKRTLKEEDLEKILSKEEKAKYRKIKARIEGLSNPSLIPCPFPNCESYAKKQQLSKTKICKCENNHKYCSKCLVVIKGNFPEHKCNKKKEETMEYLLQNRNIKQCPNCHCYVQRELAKGCNNMTCTNPWCGYQFCWICQKKYDAYHYQNPFSPCFGLSETDLESKLARYKIVRVGKCILIFFLLIFIAFPICLSLFSIISVTIYVVAFVIDGSTTKHIKIKDKNNIKVVNIFMYMCFAFYAIAFIPLGYIAFALGIIGLPIYCLIQRQMRIKQDAISEG